MSILKKIDNWFSRYKNSIFIYRDGFFDMPYLSNSPETIVKSIARIPLFKHSKGQQSVTSNTPFIKGVMYYEKIEEGLWLIHGDVHYKTNVNYKKTKDKKLTGDEYYFLNLTVAGMKFNTQLINGIPYINGAWGIYKPNSWNSNCHFKGAYELSCTLYFNDDWVNRALYSNQEFIESKARQFFETDIPFINLQEDVKKYHKIYQGIHHNFKNTKKRTERERAELKRLSYELIFGFIETYKSNNFESRILEIPDKDRKLVTKAEKMLLQNLTLSFPGIETVAREIGISETKLKATFKTIYGSTLYQYFQEKQMQLARDILLNGNSKVKEVARSLGYENASKFAAAFKKQIGVSPSELVV